MEQLLSLINSSVVELVKLTSTKCGKNSWLIENKDILEGIQCIITANIVLGKVVHDKTMLVDVLLHWFSS